MNTEQSQEKNISKKPTRKQASITGVIVVVLVALIVGFGIYNTPDNRLSRQLDLGQKYLEEHNYEQAIVEFDKAIAIDPMSVEAYLGKVEAYIGLGDLQSAFDTLQTGYALTGDERLKEELDEVQKQLDRSGQGDGTSQVMDREELQGESQRKAQKETQKEPQEESKKESQKLAQEGQDYIELPFSVSGITIKGYDLLEPHFNEVAGALGIPLIDEYNNGNPHGTIVNQYGELNASDRNTEKDITITFDSNYQQGLHYGISDTDTDWIVLLLHDESGKGEIDNIETICDSPIYPSDNYEKWCEAMAAEMIKSSIEMQSTDGGGSVWLPSTDSPQIFLTRDGWRVNSYSESTIGETQTSCNIGFWKDGWEFRIFINMNNGIVQQLGYSTFPPT